MTQSRSGVYLLTNTVTGDRYVGSSADLVCRRSTHFRDMRLGRHHNRGIARLCAQHGADSFTFEVLEECPVSELFVREAHHIDRIRASLNRAAPPRYTPTTMQKRSVGCVLPVSMKNALRIAAAERGVSLSELATIAITRFLDREEADAAPRKPAGK